MAIISAIILVLIWVFIGLGFFSLLKIRGSNFLKFFLAPALGLAVNIISLFILSRCGYPIKTVAIPLVIAGGFLIGYFLLRDRNILRSRIFIYFCLLCMCGFLPFTWPMLNFGFDWLAFVNGDMAFYSLSSSRFLHYGYSELPVGGIINDATDLSLSYWMEQNILGHRAGADLLLAEMVSLTGLSAHQIYMPLIVACNSLVAISAGALTFTSCGKKSSAFWTTSLVMLSPFLALEVTMQLLAQTIGLIFLVSSCVVYSKTQDAKDSILWTIVLIFLFCALAISYSEITPFLLAYFFIKELMGIKKMLKSKHAQRIFWRTSLTFLLGVCLLLNFYILDVIKFILISMNSSFTSAAMTSQVSGVSLFPYFFVPSGGAMFWGWMPLAGDGANFIIVGLGMFAMLIFFALAIKYSLVGIASAQMSVVMFLIAGIMYFSGNGFGLFKIAMYLQPFCLSLCVAIIFLALSGKLLLKVSILICLALSFLPAMITHVRRVSVDIGQSVVPFATTSRVASQLEVLGDEARQKNIVNIYSDTALRELFMLQSYYFKGIGFRSISMTRFGERNMEEKISDGWMPFLMGDLNSARNANFKFNSRQEMEFVFDSGVSAKFFPSSYDIAQDSILSATREFSLVNRTLQPVGRKLYIKPIRDLGNHLIFRQTSQGTSFLSKNFSEGSVALWGAESDPMFPGQTMHSIGRLHLYEVLGAIRGSSVLISVTASMNKQDDFLLPPIKVEGDSVTYLPVVGRGSARVFSQPISPKNLGGAKYLGIDFGRTGSFFNQQRNGLMGFYGQDIKLDIRRTVAFGRDISYLSQDQRRVLEPPISLKDFPVDLQNNGLEYSGFFEDGWISEAAYAILKIPRQPGQLFLSLSGEIPNIRNNNFVTTILVKVDDKVIYSGLHEVGNLNIQIPVSKFQYVSSGRAKIQIESSEVQRLPNGDGRPTSILIKKLEFRVDKINN